MKKIFFLALALAGCGNTGPCYQVTLTYSSQKETDRVYSPNYLTAKEVVEFVSTHESASLSGISLTDNYCVSHKGE